MSSDETASSLRTRASLLFRLRNWSDDQSWAEFYELYHNLVFNFARRSGLKHPDAEEVTQDVFKRVAETIHRFESDPNRGTFRGWLLNLTRWRITDKMRRVLPHENEARSEPAPGDDAYTATIDRVPDETSQQAADQIWEEEWQRQILETALRRLSERAPARHFQVFDLHINQGWSIMQIHRELGIGLSTIYVINHRMTKQLKAEIAKIKAQVK